MTDIPYNEAAALRLFRVAASPGRNIYIINRGWGGQTDKDGTTYYALAERLAKRGLVKFKRSNTIVTF